MEHFPNQAMAAVPDEETAYPWRDARSNMYAIASPSLAPILNAELLGADADESGRG